MITLKNGQDRQNKAQQAYETIKELIISNKLPPDTMLVERQLSEMLGISRTPIRAALQELENDGFVVSYPGKGMMVSHLAVDDIVDIYELRKSLDPLALSLFMRRDLEDEKAKMRELLEEMERYCAEGDLEAYSRCDNAFHDCYIFNTGNRRLDRINEMISDQVHRILNSLSALDREQVDVSIKAHRAIMAAIDAGDEKRATGLVKEHISQSLDRYILKATRR